MTNGTTTPSTTPGPRGQRSRHLLALGAAVLVCTAGCHSFSLNLLSREKAETRSERETAAAGPPAPGKYNFRIAPYVFLCDFDVNRDLPLFHDLANLRAEVTRELQLPVGTQPVQVYLFESKERYEAYMKANYKDLPSRRAFFVAQPRALGGAEELLVYTWWGPRIEQDLRHELTHALLHGAIRNVPLWLDEGLAEYFELPPAQKGLNPAHVLHLCGDPGSGGYQPDLDRLEKMNQVHQMNRPEYREAWAWVHLMLHSGPEARGVLTTYLQYLQQLPDKREPAPLGPKLAAVFPSLPEAFTRHVNELAAAPEPRPVAEAPR
jgi:hypothetical protein